ncbi:MAG TPA: FAD/NAD(P)-binding oxidoreductase [Intrasporangium sp.]|uniref:NAD(P)/FAD-dependent oxidoreductase n=1 Tax=Intrasporangium sp. TaxID=1925024 RepID=UPI002F94CF94
MRRIVIVGAGLAGLSAAEELRRRGHDGDLTVIGAEPHRPYRRPPLSKHPLPRAQADVALGSADHLRATWVLGTPARHLDRRRRLVQLADGEQVAFDGLVIGTGCRARELPRALHRGLPEVITVRGVDDLARLRDHLLRRPRVVIAGGGFLGSELAGSIRELGLPVELVERARLPLLRALGPEVAERVSRAHRERGVVQHLGRVVTELLGADHLEAVRLDDGTTIPAELLITAMGSEPNIEWLTGSGLALTDGVLVDETGTAAPGIVAAGDVARWPHPWDRSARIRVEHYHGALAQGTHVARTLFGDAQRYDGLPSFWAHIHDLRLHSVGFTGGTHRLHIVKSHPDGRFLAEYRHRDRVVGAITHGFVRDLLPYRLTLKETA